MTTDTARAALANRLMAEAGRIWASRGFGNGCTNSYAHTDQTRDLLTAAATELTTLSERAEAAEADTKRIDWLADRDNPIGNVELPSIVVINNLGSLRDAIDEAMQLDPDIARALDAGVDG